MSIEAYTELRTHSKIEKELLRIEAKEKAGAMNYVALEEWAKESVKIILAAEKGASGQAQA